MISKSFFDAQGRFVGSFSSILEDEIVANTPSGATVVDGVFTGSNYFDGAEVVEIPAQPTSAHAWDWNARAWIDPRTLDDLKAAAWERIKAVRYAVQIQPLVVDGRTYDASLEARANIMGAVLAAQVDPQWSEVWTLSDNTEIQLSAADIAAVGMALNAQVSGAHRLGRLLRAQIDAAGTAQELDQIIWPEASSHPG